MFRGVAKPLARALRRDFPLRNHEVKLSTGRGVLRVVKWTIIWLITVRNRLR